MSYCTQYQEKKHHPDVIFFEKYNPQKTTADLLVERSYNPNIELSKLDETKVFVVPRETDRKRVSRGTNQHTVTIDVIVYVNIHAPAIHKPPRP